MARIRQIKPEFYLDDELAQCSRDARLLFPGLWMLADRDGRLENRPAKIKAQVFPYDNDIDAARTSELLAQLQAQRFILIYEVGGRSYIQIRTFAKHQHCHRNELPSKIPAPNQNELSLKTGSAGMPAKPEQFDRNPDRPEANPEDCAPDPENSVQIPSTRDTYTSTYTYTSTDTSGERLPENGTAVKPPDARPDAHGLFLIFWECYPLKVK